MGTSQFVGISFVRGLRAGLEANICRIVRVEFFIATFIPGI